MKLLHTSDWHLGRTLYGRRRYGEFEAFLHWLAETMRQQGTEVLVVPMEDNNFNFDNYERLTGRWTMPKGFSPQFIEVRLTGTATPVIKRFSWGRGKPIESQSAFISEIPQAEANAQ